MKVILTVLFLSILLSFSACAGAPVMPLSPTVVEQSATQTFTLPPPPTAVKTELPVSTPALPSSAKPKPVIKTSIGDLVIEKVQSVKEVNDVSVGPNEKLILISLGKVGVAVLDPGNFPLDAFDKALRNQAEGEVHLSGDDGSYAVCSMAGWVAPDYKIFAMGFRITNTAKTYQLFWPGNTPVDLVLVD